MAFPEGLASHQGGLSKGVPLYCEEAVPNTVRRITDCHYAAILNVITSKFKNKINHGLFTLVRGLWV